MDRNKESLPKALKSGNVIYAVFCAILIVGIIIMIILPNGSKQKSSAKELMDYSQVSRICELATLRCFYHNVAEYEKQPDQLFRNGFFKYGYKKLWLEYSGIIEAGINASQIVISDPDENGVVEVYIPDATILNVSADKESIGEPLEETGMFTEISMEDRSAAFSEAQRNMKEEAENDETILGRAKENAKELIKQYIINVGKLTGETYTVRWIKEA